MFGYSPSSPTRRSLAPHLPPFMSLLPSTRRSSPQPSPSLSPSPDEEDLGWKTPWSYSDDSLDHQAVATTELSQYNKGKEKAPEDQPHSSASYANSGTDEGLRMLDQGRNTEAYPPTTDEEAEARRVQEVRVRLAPAHFSYLTLF